MSTAIEKLLSEKSVKILKSFKKNAQRYYVEIRKEDIYEFADYLFNQLKLRFATATGIDTRHNIEILYHFSDDKTGVIITLKVFIDDKTKPEIPSLTPIAKAFEWIEREIYEMLGVNFVGHPNLKRLLLSDDWPDGNYPLRQQEKTQIDADTQRESS